jgi:FAD synthase
VRSPSVEAESGRAKHRRIARTVIEKRPKHGRLIRATAAPTWLLDDTRKDALCASFQIDVESVHTRVAKRARTA